MLGNEEHTQKLKDPLLLSLFGDQRGILKKQYDPLHIIFATQGFARA